MQRTVEDILEDLREEITFIEAVGDKQDTPEMKILYDGMLCGLKKAVEIVLGQEIYGE